MVERPGVRRRQRLGRNPVAGVEVEDAVVEHRRRVAFPQQQGLVGQVAQAHRFAACQRAVGAQDDLNALVIERVRHVERRVVGRPRKGQVELMRAQLLVGVEPAVGVARLDRDVRMLLGELDPDPVDHIPETPGDPDADARPFCGSGFLGGVVKGLRGGFPGARLLEKLTSGLGERDALPVPHEQRKAELVLELLDVPAQRGLGDVKALGRLRHAQGVGDRR
jgi:hypothetical protein